MKYDFFFKEVICVNLYLQFIYLKTVSVSVKTDATVLSKIIGSVLQRRTKSRLSMQGLMALFD